MKYETNIKLHVLIINSSAVYQNAIIKALNAAEIDVETHTAFDSRVAMYLLVSKVIHVALVDLNLPDADETLQKIARQFPEVIAAVTGDEDFKYCDAASGACSGTCSDVSLRCGNIIKIAAKSRNENVHTLANTFRKIFKRIREKLPQVSETAANIRRIAAANNADNAKNTAFDVADLIVVASSTGGPTALDTILSNLGKRVYKPILIVQHMPAGFIDELCDCIGKRCALPVVKARDGESICCGRVYVAPGGMHMTVTKACGGTIKLVCGGYVNGVRPAADVLFKSVAQSYSGKNILSITLTGIGRDGVDGVLSLKKSTNCYSIAQSERTCAVYGMPEALVQAGAADEIIDVEDIACRLSHLGSMDVNDE